MNKGKKLILALTRHLDSSVIVDSQSYHLFHFRGLYKGERINRILVELKDKEDFVTGEDYLLALEVVMIKNNEIRAKLIKYREV